MNTPTGNRAGPQVAQGADTAGPPDQPGIGAGQAAPGDPYHQAPPGGPGHQAGAGAHSPPPGGQHEYGAYPGAVPWAGAPSPPPGHGYAAYGPPPYHPAYGYYAAPGVQMPPPAASGPQPSGFEAAFNEMADQSGLGMLKGLFSAQDGDFWKGALVGAAVVILMTNDELRQSLLKGVAKTADAMKSGFSDDESADTSAPEDTEEEKEA